MNTNTNTNSSYTAFAGFTHLVTGDLKTVLTRLREPEQGKEPEQVLVFHDRTGRQVDFDLRGSLAEVLARVSPPAPKKGPGRPRLGVVCREVSLLPGHWEWLERQPRKASGTIRRLVEAARKSEPPGHQPRQGLEAAGKFMWAMTGNLEGFEEATRALYAGKWTDFDKRIASWPPDIKRHLAAMVQPARDPAGAQRPAAG